MTTSPPLIELLSEPDPDRLAAALAEDVRFRSPYADYHGRADVRHLLSLIAHVLADVKVVGSSQQEDGTRMTLVDIGPGAQMQGVLCERHDDAGRLADAMLLLRPYAGLRAAMAAMAQLMEAEPLPSAR